LLLVAATGARAAPPTAPSSPFFSSIADAVASRNDLSLLVQVVEQTGLTQQFASPDLPATIFAPTNGAFLGAAKELGLPPPKDGRLELPRANSSLLLDILRLHVVPGTPLWSLERLKDERPRLLTLLPGAEPLEIGVDHEGGVTVRAGSSYSTAKVVQGDVYAGQAVIHVIDRVLLPGSI
jgi:uncharacterized surface protein with fasciclin (FAS1) repeats